MVKVDHLKILRFDRKSNTNNFKEIYLPHRWDPYIYNHSRAEWNWD